MTAEGQQRHVCVIGTIKLKYWNYERLTISYIFLICFEHSRLTRDNLCRPGCHWLVITVISFCDILTTQTFCLKSAPQKQKRVESRWTNTNYARWQEQQSNMDKYIYWSTQYCRHTHLLSWQTRWALQQKQTGGYQGKVTKGHQVSCWSTAECLWTHHQPLLSRDSSWSW